MQCNAVPSLIVVTFLSWLYCFSCPLPSSMKIPTPLAKLPDHKNIKNAKEQKKLNEAVFKIGVFEGAGNQSKGCYRPAQVCRMRINEVDDFCPVCQRAIRRITDFYTGK